MTYQATLDLQTPGRSTTDITAELESCVQLAEIHTGSCHLFLQHTSASLLVTENADPRVRRDLEAFLARMVPDGDSLYTHTSEGPDDMPAHVRAALLATSLTLPIREGRLALGTWQGVFLYEHRHRPHGRRIIVTIEGEGA